MYSYVSNNPLIYTDPSGLGFWSDLGHFFLKVGLNILTGGLINFFGGAVNSANSGPWSEQLPIGVGSGGGLNTGTVFGSGNTGPYIFSLEHGTQPQTSGQFLRAYWSTAGFLFNFLTGTGPSIRYYGPNDYRTRDLMSSKGFQVVNQQIKQACKSGSTNGPLDLSTPQGAKDIPYDVFHSPVGVQAGGYNGTWSTSGGTTQVNIVNYAGAQSFFYHAASDRTGTSGPFRTIKQTFVIKEPSTCGN